MRIYEFEEGFYDISEKVHGAKDRIEYLYDTKTGKKVYDESSFWDTAKVMESKEVGYKYVRLLNKAWVEKLS